MAAEQAVLERVRKLLALASSPNIHEAASAAAKAQALIERHRLQSWLDAADAEAADPIEGGQDTPLEVARRLRKWKVVLATVLADANDCKAYTAQRGSEEAIIIAGRPQDRAAVFELWAWLDKRIEWLSATHGAGRSRRWHEAFRVGAVDAVAEQLRGVAEEVRREQAPGTLVRLDPLALARRDAMERWAQDHLQPSRGRGIRVDAKAWERGKAAGAGLLQRK
jgi:hypothetical protein